MSRGRDDLDQPKGYPVKNALILEDSITCLKAIVPDLRKAGYDVSKAVSIRNAIQILCATEFALVILDVSVPEAPGKAIAYSLDLIGLARSLNPTCKILVWSANEHHRVACEAHGVRFFHKEDLGGLKDEF